jgi:hypothetical protein
MVLVWLVTLTYFVDSRHRVEKDNMTKTLATVTIELRDDGNVTVSGPLNNPPAMMDILGKALLATAQHSHAAQSPIIQPSPKLAIAR